ncbi:hypothetical protein ACFLYR_09350 [Chloroflexota bacterium]
MEDSRSLRKRLISLELAKERVSKRTGVPLYHLRNAADEYEIEQRGQEWSDQLEAKVAEEEARAAEAEEAEEKAKADLIARRQERVIGSEAEAGSMMSDYAEQPSVLKRYK